MLTSTFNKHAVKLIIFCFEGSKDIHAWWSVPYLGGRGPTIFVVIAKSLTVSTLSLTAWLNFHLRRYVEQLLHKDILYWWNRSCINILFNYLIGFIVFYQSSSPCSRLWWTLSFHYFLTMYSSHFQRSAWKYQFFWFLCHILS